MSCHVNYTMHLRCPVCNKAFVNPCLGEATWGTLSIEDAWVATVTASCSADMVAHLNDHHHDGSFARALLAHHEERAESHALAALHLRKLAAPI